jgi:glycerol uptake facilitator protein
MKQPPSLGRECLAEFIGTFILVFFGTGSVHVAVSTGALQGLWQVAVVWGVAIGLAIHAVGSISGCHINPAMTVAFAAWRKFPARNILPFVLAQVAGAFAAAATLYALFHGFIEAFEAKEGLVRGAEGSQLSAMVFGEYFPNPAIFGTDVAAFAKFSLFQAMLAEFIGTAFLAFFVFSLTDERNDGRPEGTSVAIYIGLAVSIIICVIAPLTQCGLNPARDFGPRLFAWFAGWGEMAIPGPRGGFLWVYILAPIVGAVVGGLAYDLALHPSLPAHKPPYESKTRGDAPVESPAESPPSKKLAEKAAEAPATKPAEKAEEKTPEKAAPKASAPAKPSKPAPKNKKRGA